MNHSPRFLVFGGLDETGKTTQSKKVVEYLNGIGIPTIWTYEPGGTELGKELRQLLLHQTTPLSPKTQLLLFQAAREEHLENVIRPALKEGKWVISDRFFESSFIYQGMMGLEDEFLLNLHKILGQHEPNPDLHLLFTGRIGNREEQNQLDAFCRDNREEMEKRIHTFATHTPSHIFHVQQQTEEEIFQEILSVLQPFLPR